MSEPEFVYHSRAAAFDRPLLPLLVFTLAYFLAGIAVILLRRDYEFLVYIGVMAAVAAVVYRVHLRVNLARASLWGLSLWGLLHLAGGLTPVPPDWPVTGTRVLYSLWLIPGWLKYDHVVHACGFGVTTWVCWQGLAASLRAQGLPAAPTGGRLALAAAAGMGFGALNEVLEFAVTLIVPHTNVGGYVNTGWDLVSNLVGALATVALIAWADRRQ